MKVAQHSSPGIRSRDRIKSEKRTAECSGTASGPGSPGGQPAWGGGCERDKDSSSNKLVIFQRSSGKLNPDPARYRSRLCTDHHSSVLRTYLCKSQFRPAWSRLFRSRTCAALTLPPNKSYVLHDSYTEPGLTTATGCVPSNAACAFLPPQSSKPPAPADPNKPSYDRPAARGTHVEFSFPERVAIVRDWD